MESGILGEVKRVSTSSPHIKFTYVHEQNDELEHEVHIDDILFVVRGGNLEKIQAIDLIQYDKIISITPHQLINDTVSLF